ncbi:Poly [ADP-ribose] polymerase 1, partial [Branchiostoma belcheri]
MLAYRVQEAAKISMADDEGKAYKAEYAKSNRASCKLCKGNITKDSLRLARMVQVPNWFHYSCFFKKCKPSSTVEFSGVTGLRWDDQEKLKKTIGGEGSSAGADAGGDEVDAPGVQGLVRISKKVDEGDQWGPKDLWHHVDCFVEKREELGFTTDMAPSVIQGYKKLSKDDQDILVKKLGSGTTGKRKAKGSNGAAAKKVKAEETEEEKKLKEQSKLVWKIRDELSKSMENSDLKELLLANDQDIPSGESALLDRLSDGMAFGALQRCPECNMGSCSTEVTGTTVQATLLSGPSVSTLHGNPRGRNGSSLMISRRSSLSLLTLLLHLNPQIASVLPP